MSAKTREVAEIACDRCGAPIDFDNIDKWHVAQFGDAPFVRAECWITQQYRIEWRDLCRDCSAAVVAFFKAT